MNYRSLRPGPGDFKRPRTVSAHDVLNRTLRRSITARTFQGRLLLRPSPELTNIILGIIGMAQALYCMTIHAFGS